MSHLKTKIVVADDDPQIVRLLTRNLQMAGYTTIVANNGQQAVELITQAAPSLVLLDIIMPQMDGLTACKHIRAISDVPIIIITARGNDKDKVRGLDVGADDYLTKPFSVDELLARVRAVLRRTDMQTHVSSAPVAQPLQVGDICIDFEQRIVTNHGIKVDLTPTEYQILAYMLQNAGRILTQNMVLEHVWGVEYIGEHHMLQVNINRLRRKIETDPAHPLYIITKSGVGYVFVHGTQAPLSSA